MTCQVILHPASRANGWKIVYCKRWALEGFRYCIFHWFQALDLDRLYWPDG